MSTYLWIICFYVESEGLEHFFGCISIAPWCEWVETSTLIEATSRPKVLNGTGFGEHSNESQIFEHKRRRVEEWEEGTGFKIRSGTIWLIFHHVLLVLVYDSTLYNAIQKMRSMSRFHFIEYIDFHIETRLYVKMLKWPRTLWNLVLVFMLLFFFVVIFNDNIVLCECWENCQISLLLLLKSISLIQYFLR